MLKKVRQVLEKVAAKGGSPAAMRYISVYALILLAFIGLYLAMTFFEWYRTGVPDLKEMREMISTMVSGAFVAAVSFVCKSYADINGKREEADHNEGKQHAPEVGGKK